MRRMTSVAATAATTLALLGTALVAAPPATSADGFDRSVHTAAKDKRTPFAYRSVTYGSRVRGGEVPASSGTTSYQAIGCTNVAGVTKTNDVAAVEIPGLGSVRGVTTRNWTTRRNGVHSSYATHDIAKIVLSESSLGELAIRGISSYSRAFHDGQGFKTETKTEVARLTFTPSGGEPQTLAIPTPGNPIVIPGLLEIKIGAAKRRATRDFAKAEADALDVRLIPTNTRVRVAHTAAQLRKGVTKGLFSGFANATRVSALNNIVSSGPQPLIKMPCPGTKGKVKKESLAEVDLGPVLQVGAASVRQKGTNARKRAFGFEEARVASVDLGDGQLVIKGIVARANVQRAGSKIKADSRGTRFLSATVNGEEYSFPELDGLSIPGLVEIETGVVKKRKSGIDVTAVRLTLLDGTGAVVELGRATLAIAGSGL